MASALSKSPIPLHSSSAEPNTIDDSARPDSRQRPAFHSLSITELFAWLIAPLRIFFLNAPAANDQLALSDSHPELRSPKMQPPNLAAPLLQGCLQAKDDQNGTTFVYQASTASMLAMACGYHVVGTPVYPTSVIVELAEEIAYSCKAIYPDYPDFMGSFMLTNLTILEDVQSTNEDEQIFAKVTASSGRPGAALTITLCSASRMLAHGELADRKYAEISKLHAIPSIRASQLTSCEFFSSKTIYDIIFPRFMDIPPSYRSLESMKWDSKTQIAAATMRLPADHDRRPFKCHPAFLDSMIQLAVLAASLSEGPDDFYVVERVSYLQCNHALINLDCQHTLTCTLIRSDFDTNVRASISAASAVQPSDPVCVLYGLSLKHVRLIDHRPSSTNTSDSPAMHQRPLMPSRASSAHVFSSPQRPANNRSHSCSSRDHLQTIFDILREACHLKKVSFTKDTELSSIGVDSLMLIEIFTMVQSRCPHVRLTRDSFSHCQRVVDIATTVERAHELTSHQDHRFPMDRSNSYSSFSSTLVEDEDLEEGAALSSVDGVSIKDIMSSVLGIPAEEIEDDSSFDSYGLDSLASLEVIQILKTEFDIDIDPDFFSYHASPHEAQTWLSRQWDSSMSLISGQMENLCRPPDDAFKEVHPVINIQRSSDESADLPLYLIHDGSGLVDYYSRLDPLGRDVWGIENPHFHSKVLWDSLEQMAQRYADLIMVHKTGESLILGGT